MLPRAIAHAQRDGAIACRFDPQLATITLVSLAAFPFLAAPILRANLDYDVFEPRSCERLAAHTLEVLRHGFGDLPPAV